MSNEQTQVGGASTQSQIATRPPLPPFTRETAIQKVRLAEDAWNSRDPEKVALAYTIDSLWRNRAEFPNSVLIFSYRNSHPAHSRRGAISKEGAVVSS